MATITKRTETRYVVEYTDLEFRVVRAVLGGTEPSALGEGLGSGRPNLLRVARREDTVWKLTREMNGALGGGAEAIRDIVDAEPESETVESFRRAVATVSPGSPLMQPQSPARRPFRVGDRVRLRRRTDDAVGPHVGMVGDVMVWLNASGSSVGVSFDYPFPGGHSLGGHGVGKTGWWCKSDVLEHA